MVVDIIEVLAESTKPRDYWYRLKEREEKASGVQLSTICRQFKMIAQDGKMRETECANTEAMFRIIQSIPSPKAEPFKLWLAKVGYERVQEIENPELAAKRARQYYRDLGYDEKWIETRLQTIAIRGQLTDEWKTRGVHHVRRRRHTPKCHKKRCSRLCGKSRRCLLKAVLLPAKH